MANFKPSSFIPKEPLSTQQQKRTSSSSKSMNLLLLIGIIIAVFALLFAGGMYGYDYYLSQQLTEKRTQLQDTQSSFEPELIQELIRLDDRMQVINTLLQNHTAITPALSMLEQETIRSVQITDFQYKITENGGEVTGNAIADGYGAVALQADAFREKEEIQKPNVANFRTVTASGEENNEDMIEFQFEFIIPKEVTQYKNVIGQS